jgi:hypothetical protein
MLRLHCSFHETMKLNLLEITLNCLKKNVELNHPMHQYCGVKWLPWVIVENGFIRHCLLLVTSDYNWPFDYPFFLDYFFSSFCPLLASWLAQISAFCYTHLCKNARDTMPPTVSWLPHICCQGYMFTTMLPSNGHLCNIYVILAFQNLWILDILSTILRVQPHRM